MTEDRITKAEKSMIEFSQYEQPREQTEHKRTKLREPVRLRTNNICIIRVPERGKKGE